MILLAHMLFGAAVGYKTYSLTGNIWLAGAFCFLSHYFLDLFPHIEYLKSAQDSIKNIKEGRLKSSLPDVLKVIFDFLAALAAIFIISKNEAVIYFFALLAVFPDGFTVINYLFKSKLLKVHQKIHGELIQYFTKIKKPPFFWRIFTQAIAILIGIALLAL